MSDIYTKYITNHYAIICFYLRSLVMLHSLFVFIEFFHFVGKQIGSKVLVFAQLVQTLSQVNVLFLVFWFCAFAFGRFSAIFL